MLLLPYVLACWSPAVFGRQTSESKTVQPVLWSVHFHMFTSLQYSDVFTGCLAEPEFPLRLHASVSTPSPLPPLLISLTFYICTLLLVLYVPVTTRTRLLKIPFYKCKTKGDRAFSYFGPSVWNSLPPHIRNATIIDTFKSAFKTYLFNLQESDYLISAWFALYVCVCVCVCVWCGVCVCLCVCVCELRGRERGGGRERECVCNRCGCASMSWCIIM